MRSKALILAVAALAGCSSSSSPPPPPPLKQQPASNTGAIASVVVGSMNKLYLPAPSRTDLPVIRAHVAVVDAAAPSGTSGAFHYVDLGVDGAFGWVVGGEGSDVVAVDNTTNSVYFIDTSTDTLRGSVTMPPEAQLIPSSSAPGHYATGIAVDSAARTAYVGVSFGFIQYNLDTLVMADTYAAPASESFTLDRTTSRLYAPFYLCDPATSAPDNCVPYVQPGGPDVTDSLTVVDLAAHQNYTLVDPDAADAHAPLGFEVDAVAVDFGLGLAVMAVETTPALQVLDLNTATLDPVAFTASATKLTVPTPDSTYTQLTVDPATHIAVVSQENAAGVIFLDLAKAKHGLASYLSTTMPDLPDGDPWFNPGDPHGSTIGVVNGRPYAFMMSGGRTWIARIDLQGIAEVLDEQGTFASKVAYISVPPPP